MCFRDFLTFKQFQIWPKMYYTENCTIFKSKMIADSFFVIHLNLELLGPLQGTRIKTPFFFSQNCAYVIYECPPFPHSMSAPIWMTNMQKLRAQLHGNTIELSVLPKPFWKLGLLPHYIPNPLVRFHKILFGKNIINPIPTRQG